MNRVVVVSAAALAITACIRSHDPMIMLSNAIESKADSLRTSRESTAAISRTLSASEPWVIVFVPKDGLDVMAAVRTGIREDQLKDLTRGLEKWGGAAVILYGTRSTTSITRLPDTVDVSSQSVLRGNSGEIHLAIHLFHSDDEVEITSVGCDPCGGRN